MQMFLWVLCRIFCKWRCCQRKNKAASVHEGCRLNHFSALLCRICTQSCMDASNSVSLLFLKNIRLSLCCGSARFSGREKLQRLMYSSQCASFQVSRSELRSIMRWCTTSGEVSTQITARVAPFSASLALRSAIKALSRTSLVKGALTSTRSL